MALALLLLAGCQPRELVRLPVSDGISLATEISTPDGFPNGGPYPAILVRTPYGRQSQRAEADKWTRRGYVFIAQELRGTGGSTDPNVGGLFLSDGWGPKQDARETIDWILAQSWSNAQIGTLGFSAPGIAGALASGASQDISAQVIEAAAASLYGEGAYIGGVPTGELDADFWDQGGVWRANPSYNDLWASLDTVARAPEITAPALHIGGWYDLFIQGAIKGFLSRQVQGGPGAKGKQKLIIGPWIHDNDNRAGGLTFPNSPLPQSPIGLSRDGIRQQFLDFWLRGVGTEPAFTVLYYTMGAVGESGAPGNVWRIADTWPPEAKDMRAYYFYPGRGLSTAPPLAVNDTLTYTYDPQNPVPTIGGQLLYNAGTYDQRAHLTRSDVIDFYTEPLVAPLEATGPIRVRLFVSTTAIDTDFTAKLLDVYPDGRSYNLVDGIQRMRYRLDDSTPDFVSPGQRVLLEVDLWSTSHVFNTGHRIGVYVSSSNAPRFLPNPNNGDDYIKPGKAPVPAQNTVYLGTQSPSALYLPVSALLDLDGDGLNEAQEAANGTDPLDPDTDNDGFFDGTEVNAGSNPLDPTSAP